MGRGPVCGMMTRRTGGPAGAGDAASDSTGAGADSAWAAMLVAGVGSADGGGATGAAGGATGLAATTSGMGAGEGGGGGGATAGFGVATAAAGAAAATAAGRSCWVCPAAPVADAGAVLGGVAGGRAMTGPTGGLLAIAGACGGTTMFACGRGCGTMRRGASGEAGVAGATEDAAGAATTRWPPNPAPDPDPDTDPDTDPGTDDGGAATAAGRGGAALMADSACLRSRMALSASPGFETLERSNLGLVSTGALDAGALRPPWLK
jgi:hypothetical protein